MLAAQPHASYARRKGEIDVRRSTKIALGGLTAAVVIAAGIGGYFASTKLIWPSNVTRPASSKEFAGDRTNLLRIGTERHGDTSLSPIGRSCNTCHLEENSYNETFNRPYPHYVQSVRYKTGLSEITAEGMVQFCMISAMEGRPLDWDSEALTALTAFVLERHRKVLAGQQKQSALPADSCGAPIVEMTPVPPRSTGLTTAAR
jgi:hypothetical protein